MADASAEAVEIATTRLIIGKMHELIDHYWTPISPGGLGSETARMVGIVNRDYLCLRTAVAPEFRDVSINLGDFVVNSAHFRFPWLRTEMLDAIADAIDQFITVINEPDLPLLVHMLGKVELMIGLRVQNTIRVELGCRPARCGDSTLYGAQADTHPKDVDVDDPPY